MNAPHEIPESIGGADRYKYRNASDTPKIMRASPFGGWQSVKDAINGVGFKGNVATSFGHEHEAAAIDAFQFEFELTGTRQARFIKDGYAASLDFLSSDGEVIGEIKCPYQGKNSAIWKAVSKADPSYYEWQIQHQLMVCPTAKVAYLFIYDPTDGTHQVAEILPNEGMQNAIRTQWDAFYEWLKTDTPDPGDGWIEQTSDTWNYEAEFYRKTKKEIDRLSELLEESKKNLIEMAEGDKVRGAGITVVKATRQGSVDYKKIPELKGIDLDQYRGKSTEYWTVK